MNYVVYLDAGAGELEKILSGIKTMIVKDFDPTHSITYSVSPGDSLYFLRNQDDYTLRVKASVVRVLSFSNHFGEDLSYTLKEMQSRLQLTEDQYNYWSAKGQVLLVEFNSAHKISVIHIDKTKITQPSDWITFEEFSQVT